MESSRRNEEVRQASFPTCQAPQGDQRESGHAFGYFGSSSCRARSFTFCHHTEHLLLAEA